MLYSTPVMQVATPVPMSLNNLRAFMCAALRLRAASPTNARPNRSVPNKMCIRDSSSGSGKSTLLHLMGGVDRPTSGTVRLAGADVYARSDEELAVLRRREVGLVYQFYNLIPVLNVVENMTLPVLMDGRPVNEERLRTLLDGLGLRGHEGFLPNQLSGGQQQRVAIGRALMNAPAVVLADEPTGNLDSRNSLEIMALLRDSNRHFNQTLVVITHDEDIACAADRVIAIEDGCVASDERRR